ncbi:acid-sensing ion channel 1C [Silurus meridionalis]|nr:acid-sensing ion channel 1C [Silurus meridionalis]
MKGDSEDSIESIRPSNLQAFANSSTLHGMSHIFAYGHMTFRRILWTLSFLGSLGLLLVVCMDRVFYYFEFPHVTKLDEVAATNLTFPAITLCNLNEFRFSKMTKNDIYHVGELLALLNENYQIANPNLAEPEFLAALKEKANFANFNPKQFSMTDFYNRTGHDISDMLLQCTFQGQNCYHFNFTTPFKYQPSFVFGFCELPERRLLKAGRRTTGKRDVPPRSLMLIKSIRETRSPGCRRSYLKGSTSRWFTKRQLDHSGVAFQIPSNKPSQLC